jgi:hypothetical protein
MSTWKVFPSVIVAGFKRRLLIGLTAATAAAVCALAHADPLPIPRPASPGGSCPHGYLASGSYCVPSLGAQDAVPLRRGGNCPFGWLASGSACLKSGSGR